MAPETSRVVLIGGIGFSTNVVCHALQKRFGDVPVILETEEYRRRLLARRLRKLGVMTVAGAARVPRRHLPAPAADRRPPRPRDHGAPRARRLADRRERGRGALLQRSRDARLAPAVVVVNGTWILMPETLGCVAAPFINTHAGITPFCRGVHGAYWALAEGRPDLVGTTVHVHLVDRGIDTGQVLGQATFRPGPEDSFATYPYPHTAAGVPILLEAVAAALEGSLAPRPSIAAGETSCSAPIRRPWGYVWRRAVNKVRRATAPRRGPVAGTRSRRPVSGASGV